MLKNLYIKSFVIIDELSVDFEDGMSVLTGETGAGKSIIIDALGQLGGHRSSSSLVRKGEKKATIQGLFHISANAEREKVFESIGLDFDEDVNITKDIYANGKSSIKINYRPTTNAALKILAPILMDIHSQFETQKIFNVKNHLKILDDYIGEALIPARESYEAAYTDYQTASQKLKKMTEEDFSDEAIEYYQSQYDELKNLDYTDDDVDAMEKELDVMKNFESMSSYIRTFDEALDSPQGAIEAVHSAVDALENIKDTGSFGESYDNLYNLYYSLQDVHENVMNEFNAYDFDEYRFNELQETLYSLQRLKNKYGYSMADIYKARDELENKIEAATHREDVIRKLTNEQASALKKAEAKAEALNKQREKAALQFEKQLRSQLDDLYLSHAKLKVDFQETKLNRSGKYNVTFMVSMNEGQAFTPLNESASGGEISRLMLAIKTIILAGSDIDTVIFDEADTGVSGKIGSAIGEKMAELAHYKQVICITHLPQVAVCAAHHYAIVKQSNEEGTYSHMRLLNEKERVGEIAKMLSGENITEEAMNNARRLLKR